jgi:hypothetical protein
MNEQTPPRARCIGLLNPGGNGTTANTLCVAFPWDIISLVTAVSCTHCACDLPHHEIIAGCSLFSVHSRPSLSIWWCDGGDKSDKIGCALQEKPQRRIEQSEILPFWAKTKIFGKKLCVFHSPTHEENVCPDMTKNWTKHLSCFSLISCRFCDEREFSTGGDLS